MTTATQAQNKRLFVICGTSGSGKTASLRNLKDQEGVLYLNCESGKDIPFKHDFNVEIISDPWQVIELFEETADDDNIHTIVVDSITFLMDMFESMYVFGAEDTRAGWQAYQQFWKGLMQEHVSVSKKRIILLAHVDSVENDETGLSEVCIPVKGALKKNGLEAYFSIVVMARTMSIKKLTNAGKTEFLEITPREEALGFKYVFQTMKTKETTNTRIRGPMDLWLDEDVFIDNDAGMALDLIDDHYNQVIDMLSLLLGLFTSVVQIALRVFVSQAFHLSYRIL